MPMTPQECVELRRSFKADLTRWEQQVQTADPSFDAEEELSVLLDSYMAPLSRAVLPLLEQRAFSSTLWEENVEVLSRGELQTHARLKPRGYAGDFELFLKISNGYQSPDVIGRCFDAYFQKQAAPAAVRGRMELVTQWATKHLAKHNKFPQAKPPHLVSIGCGSGQDILNAVRKAPAEILPQTAITLLDLDPAATEYAANAFAEASQDGQPFSFAKFVSQQANLMRLPKRKDLQALIADATQIYCTGLFDYLAEEPAQDLLACFWEQLAPGGSLYVFNFAPHNPTRAYMEWIGDWYLIYRTESDLQKLALNAGIPVSAISHGAEPQGIDLYISATKPR